MPLVDWSESRRAEAGRQFAEAQRRRWQETHPVPPKPPRAPLTWKTLAIWVAAVAVNLVVAVAALFFVAAFLNA